MLAEAENGPEGTSATRGGAVAQRRGLALFLSQNTETADIDPSSPASPLSPPYDFYRWHVPSRQSSDHLQASPHQDSQPFLEKVSLLSLLHRWGN